MATKTVQVLESDVTGEEIGEGEGATAHFTDRLTGVEYAFDAFTDQIDEFRKVEAEAEEAYRAALAPWVALARKVDPAPTGRKRGARIGASVSKTSGAKMPELSREASKAIRDWAATAGYEISNRGRIPNDVREAYDKAHA